MILRLFLLLCLSVWAGAGNLLHVTATSSTRVLSMGGCMAANSRLLDASLYNPAALRVDDNRGYFFALLDPGATANVSRTGEARDAWESSTPGSLVLRGVYLGWDRVNLALSNGEYMPQSVSQLSPTQDGPTVTTADIVPLATVGFALDEKVSLGISAALRRPTEGHRRLPVIRYGVLIRANRHMDVGAVALHMPPALADCRREIDRLGDETVNLGVLWYPLGRPLQQQRAARIPRDLKSFYESVDLRIALDVRNVSQAQGLGGKQELHFGTSLAWVHLGEMRAGIYWPNPDIEDAERVPRISLGLGLFQFWQPRRRLRRLLGRDCFMELGWAQSPSGEAGIWLWSLRWAI